MEKQKDKLKLTVEEQIQNMIDKNIQFKLYSKEMEEIYYLFCDTNGRIKKNKSYFEKNTYIKEAYLFVCNIIKYINKKNKNPKHTNFLQ